MRIIQGAKRLSYERTVSFLNKVFYLRSETLDLVIFLRSETLAANLLRFC